VQAVREGWEALGGALVGVEMAGVDMCVLALNLGRQFWVMESDRAISHPRHAGSLASTRAS